MSFLSSTSVRMKYAYQGQSIVPQWKMLYYDSQTLFQILQLMQELSNLQGKVKKYLKNYRMTNPDFFLKLLPCLHVQMQQLNYQFSKYHFCQKQAIFIFIQMKYIQLRQKFQKYKKICCNSNQEISNLIKDSLIVQFKQDNNIKSIVDSLFLFQQSKQQEVSEQILIIWENLYIECLLLKKLINYNQTKQEKVLQEHEFFARRYIQFDSPIFIFSKQKFKKLCNQLQNQIQSYINHKKIYSSTDETHSNKFKQLVQFIGKDKQKPNLKGVLNTGLWFFGFWCGIIVFTFCFMFFIIKVDQISLDDNIQFKEHFPIWRGLSYFIFFILTLGITLNILEMKQINYKLVFSLDESFVPTSFYTIRVGTIFMTIFMIFFVLYIFLLNVQSLTFLPGILWIFMFLLLFNPLPILNWRSRLYWSKILFLMMISPFNFKAKMDFKIHWITQQFVSFKQPFHDLVYTILFYLVDPKSSYKTSIIIGETITMVVLLWRILQGFKNGFDDGIYFTEENVLIKGALKCSLGILTILFSLLYRVFEHQFYLMIWIVVAIVATLYTYHFDLKYDWKLLSQSKQNKYLNDSITFSKQFYYFAMIINFVLRISWLFNISTGIIQSFSIQPYIFIMLIAYLQIIRRSLWNLLRIQRQHSKGCQKYHATVNYKSIEDKVQLNIFDVALQKYIANIKNLYIPLKQQNLTQKKIISKLIKYKNSYYLKISNPFQMKNTLKKSILDIDEQINQQRVNEQLDTLNKKVQKKEQEKKKCVFFLQSKKRTFQILDALITKEFTAQTNLRKRI